jgi:hypothetical protein
MALGENLKKTSVINDFLLESGSISLSAEEKAP